MARPDFELPGDKDWWEQFSQLAESSLENSIGCKRVHPKIEAWFMPFLKNPPKLKQSVIESINKNFFELNESLPKVNRHNAEEQIKRGKAFLALGRFIAGSNNEAIKNDSAEVRQGMSCLATHIEFMLIQDVMSGNFLETRTAKFAEVTCGEERHPIAQIVAGYLFELSLQKGDFDDL